MPPNLLAHYPYLWEPTVVRQAVKTAWISASVRRTFIELLVPAGSSSSFLWICIAGRHPRLSLSQSRPLLQLVLDLVQPGAGAGVVEIAARCPRRADRSDHLVADLDHDASAEQQQMRQFEQVHQYRYCLRP